jgi:hypothetical protein
MTCAVAGAETPPGNGNPCPAGADLAIFLISRRRASVKAGGRPTA